MRRQSRRRYRVPTCSQTLADPFPRASTIVAHEIGNVLYHQVAGLVLLKDLNHILEQVAPLRAVKTELLSGFRERLARKPRAQDVVLGHQFVGFADIAVRLNAEVLVVEISQLLVDIRREYALVAKARQRLVESTKASK